MDITEEALIQALLEASVPSEDNPHGAMRTAELVEGTGHSDKWVRAQLYQMRERGMLGYTQIWVEDITGKSTRRSAYYLKNCTVTGEVL